MSFAIEILVYSGAIPAAISVAIVLLWRRLVPHGVADRYAAVIGFASAFFVGYALLPSWAALVVSRHWHWLPYLGAVAMVLGPVTQAEGIRAVERWLVQLMLALLAAWLLVPGWSDLRPSRPVYITLVTCYLLLIMVLLDLLIVRLPGPGLLVQLPVAAAAAAITLAVFVSLKYGQLAGIACAALAGCAVPGYRYGGQRLARGLLPAYGVVVGGVVFVGYIEPQPPMTPLLLLPAAPLALWSCVAGPLARYRGTPAAAIQAIVVLVPIAIAIVLLLVAEQTGDNAATEY